MFDSNGSSVLDDPQFKPQGSDVQQNPDEYLKESVDRNINSRLRLQRSCDDFTRRKTVSSAETEKIDVEKIVPPLVSLAVQRRAAKRMRTFVPAAEWEGFVESIGEGEFCVNMVNVLSRSPLPTDMAVFSESDVSEQDRALLKVGAIVRWVVGRERLPSGQVRNVSELYFRRLPAHTKADYARALEKANELLEGIDWDDDSQTG